MKRQAKPQQLDMFAVASAADDGPLSNSAYLAALHEARRLKRTSSNAYDDVFNFLAGQVRGGRIYQTDAMAIWRGVTCPCQYKTPFG